VPAAVRVAWFPGGSVLGQFMDRLAGLKTSKGTLQFPLERPLLGKRIVKARLAEHKSKRQRRNR
jgi:hypothetical protein